MKSFVAVLSLLLVGITGIFFLQDVIVPSKENCPEYNLVEKGVAEKWVEEFQSENNSNFYDEISTSPTDNFQRNQNRVNVAQTYRKFTCGIRFANDKELSFFDNLSIR